MSQASALEFPCEFPIKAFGRADDGGDQFAELVLSLLNPHVEDLQREQLRLNPSSNGRFVAVTVTITAVSQKQLDRIYQSLSDHEQVVMSL